jgi:polyhydroxybutyrate depolymerase
MRAELALAVVLSSACSFAVPADEEGRAAAPPGGDPEPGGNPYDPPGPGAMPTRCQGPAPALRERLAVPTSDGRTRYFEVRVPRSEKGGLLPLILNLHGFMSNPWQQEFLSDMTALSEKRGFIVAYPQGSGEGPDPYSWNATVCCPPAVDRNIDDVGFIRLLLDRLEQSQCVDRRRIYATGLSNGGFMSYRLACELSDRIAAIAPVAGQSTTSPCTPRRSVPVMHFHGTMDLLVPYLGGAPFNLPNLRFPSVEQSVSGWARRNGCGTGRRLTRSGPDFRCESYDDCKDGGDVVVCAVLGGGHSWPGGNWVQGLLLGYTTPNLKASEEMLKFFLDHPLP